MEAPILASVALFAAILRSVWAEAGQWRAEGWAKGLANGELRQEEAGGRKG